jgi:hypothetical protein
VTLAGFSQRGYIFATLQICKKIQRFFRSEKTLEDPYTLRKKGSSPVFEQAHISNP